MNRSGYMPVREKQVDWLLGCVAGLSTLAILLEMRHILHFSNPDILDYTRWYNHILANGRWASLEGSFANYNPPYIYLLSLVSTLHSFLSPVVSIKLLLMPFLLGSSALFFSICRAAGCTVQRSVLAAWVLLIAPEVVTNSLVWGQTDILEMTFLLLMIRLLMARRPGWAMFAAGIALSFKLQAIFAGPAIFALILTGELPVWSLLTLGLGYVVMLMPAELAGRSSKALGGVYAVQADVAAKISMSAANPYALLMHWVGRADSGSLVVWIDRIGLLVAGVATALMVWLFVRKRPLLAMPEKLIAAIALSAIVEPYLLPKMHDRYFFIGDTAVLLLGMIVPRMLIPAALLQVAAVMAYARFLIGFQGTPKYFVAPVLMVTVAIVLVLREVLREPEGDSVLVMDSDVNAGAIESDAAVR
jgi:Gpi18-like mannosyltransferase